MRKNTVKVHAGSAYRYFKLETGTSRIWTKINFYLLGLVSKEKNLIKKNLLDFSVFTFFRVQSKAKLSKKLKFCFLTLLSRVGKIFFH